MKKLLLASVMLLVVPALSAKPNVLFIAIDDLNDWIGALGGHPQAKTPNLDRLAEEATLFTHAYCAAPACNPSRAALMTGILPSTSGVYHNPQPWRKAMPDAVTLPQHFTKHGYWSAGAGKIYHGRYPDPTSWETYFPNQKNNRPSDPNPRNRPVNGIPNTAHFDWGPVKEPPNTMGDHKVADWVISQLGKKHNKPFFLACGIYRPHLPWYVPQKYFDLFDEDDIILPKVPENDLEDIPPAGVKIARPQGDHAKVIQYNQWKKAVHGYLASIAFADEQVGRVLDALRKSPRGDDTIVVLWTDHGWHLGEKQHWRKFTLWEEATRTPLMIQVPEKLSKSFPKGTKAGTRIDAPVGLIDLYPTLIDLCGLGANKALEGHSLVPLLKNPKVKWERPALTTHGRNTHTVRTPRWRYVRYGDGSEELYDHDADPDEWTNLAGKTEHSALKKKLSKWFPKKNAESAAYDKGKKAPKKK